MKPWQIMVLTSAMLGMLAGVLGILFPSVGYLFVIAGAAVVVVIGMKILPQGDSQ